ncbi:MAG: uroporphyrinogen-III synthase, partial [Rikenellaceae bacterium]|nr:uroporphyrinogen-III synthase [Rikenellaceae bacterium]
MKVKSILISQPAPGAQKRSPFEEVVSKYNIKVDFHPFIKVEPVSVKEFRSQRIEILAHSAVIFTNRSSIDHFFHICGETRTTVPETMKYFCVTEAIALYLQKYIVYRKRKIFFGKSTFPELMEVVLKHKDEHFLLPLPDSHKPEIPKTLDKLRIKYGKVILSHTVSADTAGIDLTKYDIVALYSPSDVATLTGNFPGAVNGRPLIAAFGNGTAIAVQEAG